MGKPDSDVLYTADVVFKGASYQMRLTHDALSLVIDDKIGLLDLAWYDVYGAETKADRLLVHTMEAKKGLKRKAQVYSLVLTNTESGPAVLSALHSWIATRSVQEKVSRRRLLVLVNPFGGAKKGRKIYTNAKRMFDRAGFLDITMMETERGHHAWDIVHCLSLSDYDGLVCVSGDGLVHEIINGLLTRSDWAQARALPLGIIPAGSGNGTLKAMGMEGPEGATLAVIKGHQEPLDIVAYTTERGVVYSHLELLWTLISDIDLQSERLRWLGPIRLEMWAVLRIIFLRRYPSKLHWLPAEPESSSCTPPEYTESDPHAGGPKRQLTGPHAASSREDWRGAGGNFTFFCAMNLGWPAVDLCLAPHASHRDGTIDLVFSTKSCRRIMLGTLLDGPAAPHVSHKHINYHKCKAFRLDPEPNQPHGGSLLDIDGEDYGKGWIEGEIFPQLLHMYAPTHVPAPRPWTGCTDDVEVVVQ
eukprot:comp11527_c0_seq1/m.5977 comp11527_c0_seq1/g.5977  ORF comp11527_c0_seq1/g.5977 comp11527_c0_seq1/m.5977 type:complete len:473 (-) comp11527_c0_seq1:722-2140(-)